MPSSRSISAATRLRVQKSPRKPCISAPSRSHARIWLCCSAESRGRPPGALRRRSASGPPPSRARRIHWHTAPEVTPRAAAISLCRQPCSCSSQARKRRPSRQCVAVADKEDVIHAASRGLDRVKTRRGPFSSRFLRRATLASPHAAPCLSNRALEIHAPISNTTQAPDQDKVPAALHRDRQHVF